MRVSKEPEERKQEILNAAIEVFAKKGYEKTSISDIAQTINVAQGLCYRYFSSKEELFDAALNEYSDILVNDMICALDGNDLNVSQIIENMTIISENKEGIYYGIFHGEHNKKLHDQLVMRVCEKLLPIVRGYLEKAQMNCEIDVPDIDSAASFCVFGQLGILLRKDLSSSQKANNIKVFLYYMLKL
ncbi:MAG: TetR/AcrR family transcriptional regulator [Bacilli bacterium]|nr:TetR/AcrR family transcriptional regulator [Bacilli bacterium]